MELVAEFLSELPALRVLDVLGSPTRRRILWQLGRKPHAVGELARAVQLSQPALSQHLRVLEKAGLVACHRRPADRRLRVYVLTAFEVSEVQRFLADLRHFSDKPQIVSALEAMSGRGSFAEEEDDEQLFEQPARREAWVTEADLRDTSIGYDRSRRYRG
jgi:DNA-binding transcriptional ArsR family regulator